MLNLTCEHCGETFQAVASRQKLCSRRCFGRQQASRSKARLPCTVDGCDRRQQARGWCKMHWQRWSRYGTTDVPAREPIPDTPFWDYVQRSDGCWEWTGPQSPEGYGYCRADGRQAFAHRRAFELFHGPIPAGGCVCHRCDNPPCVRPTHLYLGDKKTNAEDRVRRGRSARPALALPDATVIDIRRRFTAGGVTKAQLARECGISQSSMGALLNGRTYKRLL